MADRSRGRDVGSAGTGERAGARSRRAGGRAGRLRPVPGRSSRDEEPQPEEAGHDPCSLAGAGDADPGWNVS